VRIDASALNVPCLRTSALDDYVKEENSRGRVERFHAAGKELAAHFYNAGHAVFNDAPETS